jgi:hypothetical protein
MSLRRQRRSLSAVSHGGRRGSHDDARASVRRSPELQNPSLRMDAGGTCTCRRRQGRPVGPSPRKMGLCRLTMGGHTVTCRMSGSKPIPSPSRVLVTSGVPSRPTTDRRCIDQGRHVVRAKRDRDAAGAKPSATWAIASSCARRVATSRSQDIEELGRYCDAGKYVALQSVVVCPTWSGMGRPEGRREPGTRSWRPQGERVFTREK